MPVVVFQSLSRVRVFAASWTVALGFLLSSTVSRSLLRFMSTESVMLSNQLILCHLLLYWTCVLVLTVLGSRLHGFLHVKSCHLQTDSAILPFPIGCLLFLFLAWLLWLRLPVLCWAGVVRVGPLVPDLRGNAFTSVCDGTCGLVTNVLHCVKVGSSSVCWEFLSWEDIDYFFRVTSFFLFF